MRSHVWCCCYFFTIFFLSNIDTPLMFYILYTYIFCYITQFACGNSIFSKQLIILLILQPITHRHILLKSMDLLYSLMGLFNQ